MQRFAFIFVLLLLVPDAYIYWLYIKSLVTSYKLQATSYKLLWWLPSILLIMAFLAARYIGTNNAMSERQGIIAWLGVAILCIGVPKMIFMLVTLLGRAIHLIIKPIQNKHFTILAILMALGFFLVSIYGCLFGIAQLQVKKVDYYSAHLPEGFNGYRIVQISDIHSGSFKQRPDILRKMVQVVNDQQANLIVFTGDLVNQKSDEADQFIEILSQLHAPDGVYSILGNHDYGLYYRWSQPEKEKQNMQHLEQLHAKMGWKLLKDQHDIIQHKGDSIVIIGVENDGNPPFPRLSDLPGASKGTEGMFRILLSHDPTHWRREVLPTTDIDLTLSGHTHGAQFMLLGWSPASWIYDEWGGMYHEGSQSLYVNIGIGYVGLPFRFGAWPEVTVFTLHE